MTAFIEILLILLSFWIFVFVSFQLGKRIQEDESNIEYNDLVDEFNQEIEKNDLLQEENTALRKELERIKLLLSKI